MKHLLPKKKAARKPKAAAVDPIGIPVAGTAASLWAIKALIEWLYTPITVTVPPQPPPPAPSPFLGWTRAQAGQYIMACTMAVIPGPPTS